MAELNMTEEERRTPFIEWDNESLGKAVKRMALIFAEDRQGERSLTVTGAAVFLISEAVRNNSIEMIIELENAQEGEKNLGNWKIKFERLS